MVVALSWACSYSGRSSSWMICRCPGQIRTFVSVCCQELHPLDKYQIPIMKNCGINLIQNIFFLKRKPFTCTCEVIHRNNTSMGLLGKMASPNYLPQCVDLKRESQTITGLALLASEAERQNDKDVFGPGGWQLRPIMRLREMPLKRRHQW